MLKIEWDRDEGKYFVFCFGERQYFNTREEASDYINDLEDWYFSDPYEG